MYLGIDKLLKKRDHGFEEHWVLNERLWGEIREGVNDVIIL